MAVLGQVNQATGSAAGFSARALKDAKGNIDVFNKLFDQKISISISLFYLDGVKKKPNAPKTLNKGSLQDAIKPIIPRENPAAIEAAFNDLQDKVDKRNQQLFDGLKDKTNTLMISISAGIWHRNDTMMASLFRFRLYQGSAMQGNLVNIVKFFIEDKKDKKLDFDDPKFKINDAILSELVGTLTASSKPADFQYSDAGDPYTFDANTEKECQTYPSFNTGPVSGIPWKCVPPDNTYQPIKVEVTYLDNTDKAKFKVKDAVNFKLKSDTPDSQNLLWVSAGSNAKETMIVPVLKGKEYSLGGIHVVAYPKTIQKLVIVRLDEISDDVQEVPIDTQGLDPNTIVVSGGKDGKLDKLPRPKMDDKVVIDPKTGKNVIVAGPNGVCDSYVPDPIREALADEDFDEYVASLKKYFDMLYKPINVEWEIVKTVKKLMDYDLDGNNYFDIDWLDKSTKNPDGTSKRVLTEEEDLLRADCKTYGVPHVVYLIGLSHSSYPLGITIYPENTSAKVFPGQNNMDGEQQDPPLSMVQTMWSTTMHELGHSLGLAHTVPEDKQNTLGASRYVEVLRFRKFQWDIMHGRSPRMKDLVTPQ